MRSNAVQRIRATSGSEVSTPCRMQAAALPTPGDDATQSQQAHAHSGRPEFEMLINVMYSNAGCQLSLHTIRTGGPQLPACITHAACSVEQCGLRALQQQAAGRHTLAHGPSNYPSPSHACTDDRAVPSSHVASNKVFSVITHGVEL